MKTSNTARTAAFVASILLSLTALNLIANYALPADHPVRIAAAAAR